MGSHSDGLIRTTRRPYAIGLAYESSLGEADRRSGAHYTPPSVAYVVAGLAIERWRGHGVPAVHDPACGGGALLVAAADRLVELGADATAVFARLSGADLDPGAVAATRHALVSWAREHGVGRDVAAGPAVAVGVGQRLLDDAHQLDAAPERGRAHDLTRADSADDLHPEDVQEPRRPPYVEARPFDLDRAHVEDIVVRPHEGGRAQVGTGEVRRAQI